MHRQTPEISQNSKKILAAKQPHRQSFLSRSQQYAMVSGNERAVAQSAGVFMGLFAGAADAAARPSREIEI